MSLIPDVPPVLRDVRANLLDVRRDVKKKTQKKVHLKYLPQWPFMKLMIGEGNEREEQLPEESMEEILEIYFGLRERPEKAKNDDAQQRGVRFSL